jgi:hypothetical protein
MEPLLLITLLVIVTLVLHPMGAGEPGPPPAAGDGGTVEGDVAPSGEGDPPTPAEGPTAEGEGEGELGLDELLDVIGDEMGVKGERLSQVPEVPAPGQQPGQQPGQERFNPAEALRRLGYTDDQLKQIPPEHIETFSNLLVGWWEQNVSGIQTQMNERGQQLQLQAHQVEQVQQSAEGAMATWLIQNPTAYDQINQYYQTGQFPAGQAPAAQQPAAGYGPPGNAQQQQLAPPGQFEGWADMSEGEQNLYSAMYQRDAVLSSEIQARTQEVQTMHGYLGELRDWMASRDQQTQQSFDTYHANQLRSDYESATSGLVKELGFDPRQNGYEPQWKAVGDYIRNWIANAKSAKVAQGDQSPLTGIPMRQLVSEGARVAGLHEIAAKRKEQANTSAPPPGGSRTSGAQAGPQDLADLLDEQARTLKIGT